jgi:hypothetical protein
MAGYEQLQVHGKDLESFEIRKRIVKELRAVALTLNLPAEVASKVEKMEFQELRKLISDNDKTLPILKQEVRTFHIILKLQISLSSLFQKIKKLNIDSNIPTQSILDANHTHFILANGDKWGDEIPVRQQVEDMVVQKKVLIVIGGLFSGRHVNQYFVFTHTVSYLFIFC